MRQLTALALIFVSCAGPAHTTPVRPVPAQVLWTHLPDRRPVTWSFDCSFPLGLRSAVREGFAYWDEQTPVHLFEELDCGAQADVEVHHSADFYRIHGWVAGTRVFRRGDDWSRADITFYRPFFDGNFSGGHDDSVRWTVARHEVGHVIGFHHLEDDSCVMYKWVDGPRYTHGQFPKQLCDYERGVFDASYGR